MLMCAYASVCVSEGAFGYVWVYECAIVYVCEIVGMLMHGYIYTRVSVVRCTDVCVCGHVGVLGIYVCTCVDM